MAYADVHECLRVRQVHQGGHVPLPLHEARVRGEQEGPSVDADANRQLLGHDRKGRPGRGDRLDQLGQTGPQSSPGPCLEDAGVGAGRVLTRVDGFWMGFTGLGWLVRGLSRPRRQQDVCFGSVLEHTGGGVFFFPFFCFLFQFLVDGF